MNPTLQYTKVLRVNNNTSRHSVSVHFQTLDVEYLDVDSTKNSSNNTSYHHQSNSLARVEQNVSTSRLAGIEDDYRCSPTATNNNQGQVGFQIYFAR